MNGGLRLITTHPKPIPPGVEHSPSDHCKVIGTGNIHKKEETDEMAIIKVPYTIIHPWAVMIYNQGIRYFALCWTGKRTHAKDTSIHDIFCLNIDQCLKCSYVHTCYTAYNDGLLEACISRTPDSNEERQLAF